MAHTTPRTYWFKTKRYGWGWTPARWQGWLVLIVFILAIWGNLYRSDLAHHPDQETTITVVLQTFLLMIILLFICYKTGEKPRWRWGDTNTDDTN